MAGEHHRHWHHRVNLRQLVEESGDEELYELFPGSESLHANFYENFMSASDVAMQLRNVERLVPKLQALIEPD